MRKFHFFAKTWKWPKISIKICAPYFFCQKFRSALFLLISVAEISGDPPNRWQKNRRNFGFSKICWKNWKFAHLQTAARMYRMAGDSRFCKNMIKQTYLPPEYQKQLGRKFLAPYRVFWKFSKISIYEKLWKNMKFFSKN